MAKTYSPLPGVLETLLNQNHGWWYQEVTDSIIDGEATSQLKGNIYLDPSLYRLYGYEANSTEFSLKKAVQSEDLPRITAAIREAAQPNGTAKYERIRMKPKVGEYKVVHVYCRRISVDGRPLLACLHSDTVVPKPLTWVTSDVLQGSPAFMFIKRWNDGTKVFEFCHVNEGLAQALAGGKATVESFVGKSDEDYFDDPFERKAFLEADSLIMNRVRGDNTPVIREESFTPKGKKPTRILTVKSPYWPVNSQDEKPYILGIALDATPVTDVLRGLADQSDDAFYIKDKDSRYLTVNKKFEEMVGKTESQLIHRTFEEATKAGPTFENDDTPSTLTDGTKFDDVVLETLIEDKDVLEFGKTIAHVRVPLSKSDPVPWITIKKRIIQGFERYVLGVAKELFGTSRTEYDPILSLADHMPQAISVKYYCPDREKKEDQFPLVWGNRTYLDRHGITLDELKGKTDYQLWDFDVSQAGRYNEKDRIALRVCQDFYAASPKNEGRSEWKDLVERLKFANCWEFPEEQKDRHNKVHFLQTSKWAAKIGEKWFVFVAYTDVTKAEDERAEYHRHTVHMIGNANFPGLQARNLLDNILTHKCIGIDLQARNIISEVRDNILDASMAINRNLKLHLKVGRSDPKLIPTSLQEIEKLIDRITEYGRRRLRSSNAEVKGEKLKDNYKALAVRTDIDLLESVIEELLTNAINAVMRASEEEKTHLVMEHRNSASNTVVPVDHGYRGKIEIRIEVHEARLILKICDNAIPATDQDKRLALEKKFYESADIRFKVTNKQLGLCCIQHLMKKLNGMFSLVFSDTDTIFIVSLPLWK